MQQPFKHSNTPSYLPSFNKLSLPIEPWKNINIRLLVGKHVLITGASYNIGQAIAESMAEQGANIYFTDLDSKSIVKLETKLRSQGVLAKG